MTGQRIRLLHVRSNHHLAIAHQAVRIALIADRTIVQGVNQRPMITAHPGAVLPGQVILQEAVVQVIRREEAVVQVIRREEAVQVILLAEVVQVILLAEVVQAIHLAEVVLPEDLQEVGVNQQT